MKEAPITFEDSISKTTKWTSVYLIHVLVIKI